MATDLFVYGAFGGLLVFGVYRRLRATFGRQRVKPGAMRVRMVVLSALGALLLVSLPTAAAFGSAVAGGATGVAVAHLGLARTVFEKTDDGSFYTPSKWIGGAITALFLGRLAVRLVTAFQLAEVAAASGDPLAGLHRSALTLAFYFLFAGYYVRYYAGVLGRYRTGEPGSGARSR